MTNVTILSHGQLTTSPLYQYDYGQQLQLVGFPDLPAAFEAHFAHEGSQQAVVQIGADGFVGIPDAELAQGSDIGVWVYLHAGEDDGETVYHATIPVIARAKPSPEEPTPEQQSAIDQAIAALNTGVSKAEAAAESAQEAVDGVQETVDAALEAAKESGEFDGPPGPEGPTGPEGPQGEPGKTPVKGVDYWTTDDQQAIVTDAVTALRGRLPMGYNRLAWVQSDGDAWVDTGVALDGSLTVEVEMMLPRAEMISTAYTAHASTAVADGRLGCIVFDTASHKIDYYWPGVGYSTQTVDPGIDFLRRFRIVQDRSGQQVEQDGLSSAAEYRGAAETGAATIKILHSDNPNHASYSRGRVYACRIAKGSDVLRDYAPAQRVEDGAVGLYDMAQGVFYESAGPGTFAPGEIIYGMGDEIAELDKRVAALEQTAAAEGVSF